MWHVTHDTWHVKHDTWWGWGGVNILSLVSELLNE